MLDPAFRQDEKLIRILTNRTVRSVIFTVLFAIVGVLGVLISRAISPADTPPAQQSPQIHAE